MKLAIIGTGMLIHNFLPVLSTVTEIEIAALCSTKNSYDEACRLAEEYGIPLVYSDYETLLLDQSALQLDAVYIATPNNLHFEMAKKALLSDINVILEKPFVTSYDKAQELVSLSRARRLFLLEAISNQYLPIYEKLRASLPLIGDIKYADCNYSQYSSRFDRFLAGEYFKVFDPKCDGGALMDINVYNLHVIAGLFGEPQDLLYKPNLMRGVDTSGTAFFEYPGFNVTCTGAKDSEGPSRTLIQGTQGYLLIEAHNNSMAGDLICYTHSDKSRTVLYHPDGTHRMIPEFLAFDRMIREKDYAECHKRQEETLLVCRMLEQLRRS